MVAAQTHNLTPTFIQPSPQVQPGQQQLVVPGQQQLQPGQPIQNPQTYQPILVQPQPQTQLEPSSPQFPSDQSPSVVIQRVQKVSKESQVFL